MTVEELLVAALSVEGITAVVGTRITPVIRPRQEDLPAITYQTIDDQSFGTADGVDGTCQARIQIDIWAADYTTCQQVSDLVKGVLDGIESDDLSCRYDTGQSTAETEDAFTYFRWRHDYITFYGG